MDTIFHYPRANDAADRYEPPSVPQQERRTPRGASHLDATLTAYYSIHEPDLRVPIAAQPGQVGLRRAQLGGLWALASHFTVSSEPALVVMPTGSGKTAVITLIPFLVQAERVLVITSNRPVRHQIASELKSHKTLMNLGVVTTVTMSGPKVQEVVSRVATAASWESL